MSGREAATPWLRRAQPLLGTLVEIGVDAVGPERQAAVDAAFARICVVQNHLSRFEAGSDIGRFHALRAGASIDVHADTSAVLDAAFVLQAASGGVFDISLGTGPDGWRCADGRLHKRVDQVTLDLGGIGKGYAVDCAVQTLIELGVDAGWVNAGGDLRSFGEVDVPVQLRDEARGGVRPFASVRDGAFATSVRCVSRDAARSTMHTSVAAPHCVWADALNKIVAATANASHPLLARFDAIAWIH